MTDLAELAFLSKDWTREDRERLAKAALVEVLKLPRELPALVYRNVRQRNPPMLPLKVLLIATGFTEYRLAIYRYYALDGENLHMEIDHIELEHLQTRRFPALWLDIHYAYFKAENTLVYWTQDLSNQETAHA